MKKLKQQFHVSRELPSGRVAYQLTIGDAVKTLITFAVLLSILFCRVSYADTSKDMVRIACIPDAGLLDVEFRSLHDSVAGGVKEQEKRNALLLQAGFHDPHSLKFACALGGIEYLISAEQGSTSLQMCGGSPEVYLTVMRDGAIFFSGVVFGDSCNRLPSITRFTIGDGPGSWRGRETEVCYSSGKDNHSDFCDWTFGEPAEFNKRFPIDQDRVGRIVRHLERR
jgi:hypothetical protein